VNLLQVYDRKSKTPGDSPASLAARARLAAAGAGASLYAAISQQVAPLLGPGAQVVELGCGTGQMLTRLCAETGASGIGLDLSADAVRQAAVIGPSLTWVVVNVDRYVPIGDESVDLVLAIHARRNPAECARILRPGGALLVAVPGADDLVELRERVLGQRVERTRVAQVREEHAALFELVSHTTSHEQQAFDAAGLKDLLSGTYRGARTSASDAVAHLVSLTVTLSSDLLLFRRSSTRPR
jgi:SAM-dependent methyltransferase